jgi:two-component system, OmpR family, phosphate regulon response regulator PhoB
MRSGVRTPSWEARTVDVHVQRLRDSITREGEPDVIRTVRTAGYGFNMDDPARG